MEHRRLFSFGWLSILAVMAFFLSPQTSWAGGKRGQTFRWPVMTPADFNVQLTSELGEGAIVWEDANEDGTFLLEENAVDEAEFSGKKLNLLIRKRSKRAYFTPLFLQAYRKAAETLRRQKIHTELAYSFMEEEVSDVPEKLTLAGIESEAELKLYQSGIRTLLRIASVMKKLYQMQIGLKPWQRISTSTEEDRELFKRYGHPWGLADQSPFCVAFPTFLKRSSGVIPEGVSCARANEVGSPFEALRLQGDELKTIPYARVWPAEHRWTARMLKQAASVFSKIPREKVFTQHLEDLAAAFQSTKAFPYAQSDVSWAKFLLSDSVMFIRLGPDEVGGDGLGDACESRARFHFNLGIRNATAEDIIAQVKPVIQLFEKKFTELMSDPENYVERPIQVQMPTFLDVIYANGDDVGGPSGTPIGQTLPNWCGEDGKGDCDRGTMVYVNKTLKAYSKKVIDEYIMPLFADELAQHLNPQKGLDSVVYHELFHNLGPRGSTKKPGSEVTYGEKLVTTQGVSWRSSMEELKAQTGSLYMASEFYLEAKNKLAAGEITATEFAKEEKSFKEHIIYDLAWAFRMIVRGSRGGDEFNPRSPYSKLSAVQVGFLAENGAMAFDAATEKWSVDFEKMPEVITALTKKMGELYIRSDVNAVEDFFLYYMKGEGEKLLHRDVMMKVASQMPSVLFDYKVKGL